MKTVKVKVYSFDELSDEAKEKALEKWNENSDHFWGGDVRDTIKAFEEESNVKIVDWSYSPWDCSYSLDTSRISDDVLALKGNRARAWFWNNHGRMLLQPEYHYWTHDKNGKLFKAVTVDSRKYTSKVFFTRVYDGTCPLTGVCFDCDALDPMAYFCFGTMWDSKLKRRVQSPYRKLAQDNDTVESILDDCVASLFQGAKEDWKYQQSMESFRDTCEANDYLFTEDGKRWSGKYEVEEQEAVAS